MPGRTLSKSKLQAAIRRVAPFAHAFDVLKEHVVITDADAHVLYANEAAEQSTGYSLHEMLGKNPGDLWGGHMSKDFYKKMWHRIKDEKRPFSGEVMNKKKNGRESWQELRISPVLDAHSNVEFFIAVESVIADRKVHERAKEEIASIISHEALSPLTAIRWSLEHIFSRQTVTGEYRENLKEIDRQSKRLVEIFQDLTFLSRFGKGHPEFEVIELAEEVLGLQGILKKHRHVTLELKGTAEVHAFRSLVQEMLRSLLENIIAGCKTKRPYIQCRLHRTGMTFSVDAKVEQKDLSAVDLIARYLHWEGPVYKNGKTSTWTFKFPSPA